MIEINNFNTHQLEALKRYLEQDLKNTRELYESLCNHPIIRRAWVLKLQPHTIQVVCESCNNKGYVWSKCPVCGGKGIHKKTQTSWVVMPNKIDIIKIDRDFETGELRYWTSLEEYYPECITEFPTKYYDDGHNYYSNGAHIVHFNYKDAVNEANRLNKILVERGVLKL